MLYTSPVYSEARGSIGGVCYSRNRGGLYTRARAVPCDPNTSQQAAIRARVADLTSVWAAVLTGPERAAWDYYALQVPLPGPLGAPRNVGGLGMFIRSNVPRLQAGLARLDAAPIIFDLGTFTPPVIASVTAPSTASITFTAADLWHEVGGMMAILVSRGQNPSRNFFKGPYRFADAIISTDISPHALALPFVVAVGQRVFMQFRAQQPDGRTSYPFRLFGTAA